MAVEKELIALRADEKISRKEKIGVSKEAVSNWERGVTYPTPPNIDKLCELYDTNYTLINFYPNTPFNGISKNLVN